MLNLIALRKVCSGRTHMPTQWWVHTGSKGEHMVQSEDYPK